MAKNKIEQNKTKLDAKSFWEKAILAPLEKFKKAHPENGDLAFLEMIIKNRQFLNIRDFNINIDGVKLRVSPSDTPELAQAKLAEFFEALEEQNSLETENMYTDEDRQFWRQMVIPTLSRLSDYYGNDPGFRFLCLLVEKRLLTQSSKDSGLTIKVGNVTLQTAPGENKKSIQKKLEDFLEQLASPTSYREIYKESNQAGDELAEQLKKNWKSDQKDFAKETKTAGKEKIRYTNADKLFWNQVVIPNLEEMEATYPDSPEVQKLVKAIRARKFLTGGDWQITANGVKLDVKAKDSQDDKQEKLGNFLVGWQEKTYTKKEQTFWRFTVIPALIELARVYPNNDQLKVLVLSIQNRLFLRQRNLDLTVAGVTLSLTPQNTKKQALTKLKKFLDELKEKSRVGITQRQVEERLKRLQESQRPAAPDQTGQSFVDQLKNLFGASKFRSADNGGEGGRTGGENGGIERNGGEGGGVSRSGGENGGIERGGGESGSTTRRKAGKRSSGGEGGYKGGGENGPRMRSGGEGGPSLRSGGEAGPRVNYYTGGGESRGRSSYYHSSGE